MSFWDIAHGRSSELIPPRDLNPKVAQTAGFAGAAIAAAGVFLTAVYSPQNLGFAVSQGGRFGARSLNAGEEEMQRRLTDNDNRAVARRELGRKFLETQIRSGETAALQCRYARACYVTGRPKAALEAARKAFELDGSNPNAQLLTALFLLRRKEHTAAVELLQVGVLRGADSWVYSAVAEHFSAPGTEIVLETVLAAAIESYPAATVFLEQLGHLYARTGDLPSSVKFYECAKHIDSSVRLPWEVAFERGKVAASEGKVQDAQTLYTRALAFRPQWTDVLLQLALLAFQNGDHNLHGDYLVQILALAPDHPRALLMQGNLCSTRGDWDLAQDLWTRSFSLDSEMPVPWRLRFVSAETLLRQGKLAEAVEQFESAYAMYPQWAAPRESAKRTRRLIRALELEQRGDDLQMRGELESACQAWIESAELNPDNPDVFMKIGATQADRGLVEDGLAAFQKALSLGHQHAAKASEVCQAYLNFIPELGPTGV